MKRQLTPHEALMRVETLCARSEQSAREVLTKLVRWGIEASDAQKIVAHLIEKRFIDDNRFARAFVHDKITFARWGRRKIAVALAQKGISREIANESLQNIDTEKYRDTLLSLLKARATRTRTGSTEPEIATYEGRTRLYRFGISRGFETELVAQAIRELLDSYNADNT